jgi:hypothetical protein
MIPLGGLVRLDVELADGTSVRVELSRDRFAELKPRIGQMLFVAPRDVMVFVETQENNRDRHENHRLGAINSQAAG